MVMLITTTLLSKTHGGAEIFANHNYTNCSSAVSTSEILLLFFSTYTYSFLQSISGVITFYIHFLSHFKLIWGTDGYKWIRHMADFSPSILEPSVAILQHYWASWACGLSGRNVIALKLWTDKRCASILAMECPVLPCCPRFCHRTLYRDLYSI